MRSILTSRQSGRLVTTSARPTHTRQRVNGPLMAQRLAKCPASGRVSLDGPALSCGFALERVTGIEPALSAWELDRPSPVTPVDQPTSLSATAPD